MRYPSSGFQESTPVSTAVNAPQANDNVSFNGDSFRSDLLNAANSTEQVPLDFDKENDPVINMEEADIPDGSEQGIDGQASSAEAQAAAAKAAEEWYEFNANGAKKKFNLLDKEAIKKVLPLAEGARRWQSERDSWKSKYESRDAEFAKIKEVYDKLDNAYRQSGFDGVLDVLGGGEGASKAWFEDRYQKRLAYEKAPEHERARLDYEERLAKLEKLSKAKEEALTAREKQLEALRQQEDEAQLMAELRPHYNKYSFSGKLGDAEVEKEYNDMVWDKGLEAMAKLNEAGTPLSPSTINAQFKAVYDKYAKVLKVNQAATENKIVDKLKTSAKKDLAASVKSHSTGASQGGKAVDTGNNANGLSAAMARLIGLK